MVRIDKEPPQNSIEIVLGPDTRDAYLAELLRMDGLDDLEEDPNAAYCALSLTNTPEVAKPFVKERQKQLQALLKIAGIFSYDPGSAPLSPDLNLTATPADVYRTDLARVASARFFTSFDTFPSTGMGVEIEAARRYNRIPVIFHDHLIRTSRMQPDCAIHVMVSSLDEQADRITEMFKVLKQYTPGRGLVNRQPALLGFRNGEPVHLTDVVNKRFPDLAYAFDGTKPPLQFEMINHHLLIKK